MKFISIRDLLFRYDNNYIFDKFNLDLEKGSYTTIVGTNGAGKTTLIKLMLGLLHTNSYIMIDNIRLTKETTKDVRRKIGVVFENPENTFVAETVMDEIAFALENMQLEHNEIKRRITEISEYLEIEHLLERDPHRLSGGEKQVVALAGALVMEPEILIFDEAFTMVDYKYKEKIYKVLDNCNKENGTTIINITHNLEDAVYGNDIIVMDKGKIIMKGPKEEVFKETTVFDKLGFDMPFIVELSNKLKYYGLVNKLYFNKEELVDSIWK